ncbi:MAG: tetratricopeptide repeat protein [Proteobacteria bacterium]|nr:tetratricopeptide repeat protein [Pseudomonadota bacterium]
MEKPESQIPGKENRARETVGFLFLLAGAVFLAWSDSFGAPFLLDDHGNILGSTSILCLWPPWDVLFPPVGSVVGGRPLFNLSLALNHAVSGFSVWSYHLFNILVHALAAWALFGLVRRTVLIPGMVDRYGRRAGVLAFFIALVWALHPLHTDAVTYISQRAEAMMGLFFLASAWLAVRGWTSPRPRGWHALSVLAFIAGLGCKEVIVALPMVMLAYEWTFFRRNPVRAARNSPLLYAGYGAGLGLLALLVARGGTAAATPRATATPLAYLATQAQVIVHYLRTAFWPSGLSLDYGWPVISFGEALPYGLAVTGLLALSAVLLVRRNPTGFLGAWFFFILAPTSSILPLPFLAWDRRMYLPLAAVVGLAVAGGYRAGARALEGRLPGGNRHRAAGMVGCALVLAVALALGGATWARNLDYATELSIWQDTVDKRPDNHRAHEALSWSLSRAGDHRGAEAEARLALELAPGSVDAWMRLGLALSRQGRDLEALAAYQAAVEAGDDPLAHHNLSVAWLERGDLDRALAHARLVQERLPGYVEGRLHYALILGMKGEAKQAEKVLENLAARGESKAFWRLGVLLEQEGRDQEAAQWYARTLAADPGHERARYSLARVLARLGRPGEAAALYGNGGAATGPEPPARGKDF